MTPTTPGKPAAPTKTPWYGTVPSLKIFLTPVTTSPVLTGEEANKDLGEGPHLSSYPRRMPTQLL